MPQIKQFEVSPVNSDYSTRSDENRKTADKLEIMNEEREKETIIEQEIISTGGDPEVIVPPDGGWGWVVVIASFGCNMIVDGIIFSFGMFLTNISESFHASKAEVALVGSLLSGFYLMAGPFVSALANKYGFRPVTILGSIIGSLAFVLSSFSTSVEFLFVSYGIIGGIGFGLIYVPAVITVGFYFEKWRALATGIAVCGSGIGTFVLAPVSSAMIESFGWRNALLIQAALVLCCGVFGAFFRPIKPTKLSLDSQCNSETSSQNKEEKIDDKDMPLLLNRVKGVIGANSGSMLSMGSLISLNSKTVPVKSNYHYPTAKEVLGTSMHCLTEKPLKATSNRLALLKADKQLSTPNMIENIKLAAENMDLGLKKEELYKPLIENDEKVPRRHTVGSKYLDNKVYRKTTLPKRATESHMNIQRPFYRDDIFFGASLQRLPQYTSTTSLGYHLAVTRVPTKMELVEEKTSKCKLCPESIRRTLNTMLDVSLLKSPSFLLLAFSGFFTMMGFYVPFMYLTDRATLSGIELGTALWLVAAIGIANTVGRVLCGVLTSFPGCNALLVNNIAITVAGIATLFSGVSPSETYQFFYASIFGLSIACFASLRSILVVDLLGLERLTNAFGLLLLFQGVAAIIGAPIAGAFMSATGSYDASFYLSGALITFSAVMCYPVSWINSWEKRRLQANDTTSSIDV